MLQQGLNVAGNANYSIDPVSGNVTLLSGSGQGWTIYRDTGYGTTWGGFYRGPPTASTPGGPLNNRNTYISRPLQQLLRNPPEENLNSGPGLGNPGVQRTIGNGITIVTIGAAIIDIGTTIGVGIAESFALPNPPAPDSGQRETDWPTIPIPTRLLVTVAESDGYAGLDGKTFVITYNQAQQFWQGGVGRTVTLPLTTLTYSQLLSVTRFFMNGTPYLSFSLTGDAPDAIPVTELWFAEPGSLLANKPSSFSTVFGPYPFSIGFTSGNITLTITAAGA
jgi:hypothetical protein